MLRLGMKTAAGAVQKAKQASDLQSFDELNVVPVILRGSGSGRNAVDTTGSGLIRGRFQEDGDAVSITEKYRSTLDESIS